MSGEPGPRRHTGARGAWGPLWPCSRNDMTHVFTAAAGSTKQNVELCQCSRTWAM